MQIRPLESGLRPCSSPRARDLLQQVVHDKCISCINGARQIADVRGRVLRDHPTLVVGHACNQPRVDAVATIGKHREGRCHLQGRNRTRTQCHGQIGGVLFSLEPETGDPLLRRFGPYRLQDANGDHVLGLCKPRSHGHGAVVSSVVIFGLPGLTASDACVKKQRSVVDNGGRGKALFQRGGIDEGLETGTRLAPCLGCMVELVLVKIKTAHQRLDGSVAWIDSHQSTLDLGELGDFPGVFGRLGHANHGAAANLDVGGCLVAQTRLRRLESVARDFEGIAIGARRHDLA